MNKPLRTCTRENRRLCSEIMEWGLRRFGKQEMLTHVQLPFGARKLQTQLLECLAGYVTPLNGKTLAEHYLEARPTGLSKEDERWMEAQRKGRVGLWEVLRVEPGRGLEVIDLLSAHRCFLEEKRGSTSLRSRCLVLGRVVTLDDRSVFCGIHEQALPPKEAQAVLTKVRTLGANPGMARILELWDEEVGAMALNAASPGKLTNTDGEPICLLEQQFKLSKGARDEVVARILGQEGVHLDEDSPKATALTFTRPGNALHATWKNTALASVRVTKTTLKLTTNSKARADRFTALLSELLGKLATPGARVEQAMPDFRGGPDLSMDAQVLESAPDRSGLLRDASLEWLKTPLSTLGGLTPMQAVEDDRQRENLHWLLKEQEYVEAGRGVEDGVMSSVQARRLLGLTDVGDRSKHHTLELAVGAGRKISETLLDFVRPLHEDMPSLDEEGMRRLLQFAVVAWNAEVAQDEDPAAIGEAKRALAKLPDSAQALKDFDKLVTRKRALYPHDKRMVGHFDIKKRGGHFGLEMAAYLSPALADQVRAAGLKP